jgi:PKD repeat protein
MKKMLLFAFLFTALLSSAQISDSVKSCKAYFIYSFNTTIETFAPAAAINFYDQSDGRVISWFWDFGDGDSSTEQNPLHIYNYPVYPNGSKIMFRPYRTVTLTTMTADSCSATYSEEIDIYDVPNPGGKTCKSDFYFFQTGFDSLSQTATFKFINLSGAENATYAWDFSDGLTSSEAEPEMTFDFSRTDRKVCLTVSGTDSCSDQLCQDVVIDPKGWGTVPGDSTSNGCFTAFGYTLNTTIKTFAPALVLDFYAKSDQPIAKCLWNFGDGTTSEEQNPTHIFNLPLRNDSIADNPYREVCLIVTTESGCESTWCQTINIYMNNNPENDCDASFYYYIPDDVVTIPEVVPYKFVSNGQNILSWNWIFEDGSIRYDPEPVVNFDIFKSTQKVCLTILTTDSCQSTWCQTVDVSSATIDSIYPEPNCGYRFKFTSSYPVWASACVGEVTAQVVFGDSIIPAEYFYWVTPDGQYVDGPVLKNLCPTQTYTVTALTVDGCKFSSSFVFNSDGTVTELPISWWITGRGDDSYIEYQVPDSSYTVEWIGCDGSIYTNENVYLNQINCDSEKPNLILKDAYGNIVYSEKIAVPTEVPVLPDQKNLMIYPNPVNNTLSILFRGISEGKVQFEITDIVGKVLQKTDIVSVNLGKQSGINVSALTHGVYFGKIVSGSKVIASEKFIK